MNYDATIFTPLHEMLVRVASFIPTLLITFAILIGGWLLTLLVRNIIVDALKVVKFDKLADKLGIAKFLRTGGIKSTPSEAVGCVFYCLLMVMFTIISVKALGIPLASGAIDTILAYVPSVITGAVVLIIGMYVARFVSVLVYMAAKNTDMPGAATLSRLSKWTILAYATILYLREIGFASIFEGANNTIFVTGVVLALALAFGLGGKDVASRYLEVFNKAK